MQGRISKAFKNRFQYLAYCLFIADLTNDLKEPFFKKGKPELKTIFCKNEDLPGNIVVPDSLSHFWEAVEKVKDHYIVVVTGVNNELAGYLMYTQLRIFHKEFNEVLVKSDREAVLSSGRTMDNYLGLGISEYCKRYALMKLKEAGVHKVYSFSRKKNKAPQHVNLKIGMKLTHTIHIIRIFKKKLVFKIPKK